MNKFLSIKKKKSYRKIEYIISFFKLTLLIKLNSSWLRKTNITLNYLLLLFLLPIFNKTIKCLVVVIPKNSTDWKFRTTLSQWSVLYDKIGACGHVTLEWNYYFKCGNSLFSCPSRLACEPDSTCTRPEPSKYAYIAKVL